MRQTKAYARHQVLGISAQCAAKHIGSKSGEIHLKHSLPQEIVRPYIARVLAQNAPNMGKSLKVSSLLDELVNLVLIRLQ